MFRRVLVANRGEIALRVIRALRSLGVASVAIYSDADAGALHTRLADEAHRVGGPAPSHSYLNGARIIAIAKKSGAEAIHPGYGFLSENADFAQAVQEAGLVWIGPPPQAMRAIGEKVSARRHAARQGLPLAPGSEGVLRDAAEAQRVAQDVGYPVLLKASAGGGGIGMRVVREAREMEKEFEAAAATALAAFGKESVFLEKYLERPRHIELQVIADAHGNAVHLGERECSIQRRHQKLVEEAPSPALDADQRARLGELGVRLVKSVGYQNAGTLEFLHQDGKLHFNEVNARLQVEHPVTELVYGVDLVQAQLLVASGERLPWRQEDLRPHGHAIEVRLNAEDPLHDFRPSPGRIHQWRPAATEGVRVDSWIEDGTRVPAEYDNLLAKVIAHGTDRAHALQRLHQFLEATHLSGPPTNLNLHRVICQDPAFRAGDLSTRFLQERPVLKTLARRHEEKRTHALRIALALASGVHGGIGHHAHRAQTPRRLEAPR